MPSKRFLQVARWSRNREAQNHPKNRARKLGRALLWRSKGGGVFLGGASDWIGSPSKETACPVGPTSQTRFGRSDSPAARSRLRSICHSPFKLPQALAHRLSSRRFTEGVTPIND